MKDKTASPAPSASPHPSVAGERIAKLLARAGVGSRRDVERMIADGRVALNGRRIESPALNLPGIAGITVDGQPVAAAEATRLWRYYKPSGLVTSHRDEKGRATVFQALQARLPRVVSIGRLDLTTEGLLLLTNDGELARKLELPSTGWLRRYRVRVHGHIGQAQLDTLKDGITVNGVSYGPVSATIERIQGSNMWLQVGIREGKNREIRKLMEHLGLTVSRLIRIAYGPFQLGLLPEGATDEVPAKVLREQLGKYLTTKG